MKLAPEDREELVRDIAEAVYAMHSTPMLSDDERRWVRLAIKREEERAVFRNAVITKSLGALLVSSIIWLATEASSFLHHVFARTP